MYLVFTRMPGGSYCRRLGFLLLYLFRALISSLCVCVCACVCVCVCVLRMGLWV